MIRPILLALALFFTSVEARAAVFQFDITGDATASFQIDTETMVPIFSDEFQLILYPDLAGTFGSLSIADVYFYSDTAVPPGGMVIDDFLGGTGTLIDAGGPALFTGPLDAPVFKIGTFALTEIDTPGNYRIRITAVPEPATWAMLIVGFGLVGAALRQRRFQPTSKLGARQG